MDDGAFCTRGLMMRHEWRSSLRTSGTVACRLEYCRWPEDDQAKSLFNRSSRACRFRKLYPFDFATTDESEHDRRMIAIGLLVARMLRDFFKPRLQLEAEILILRHQLNILQQRMPRRRLQLRWVDRVLFIWL